MTTNELKSITSNFADIRPLLDKSNDLLKQVNKVRRQLRTKTASYQFLKDLVDIGATDTTLDDALKKYFKSLGFSKVECVGKKFGEEDIRLWAGDKLILVETTGSKNVQPPDDKIFQVFKHVPIRQKQHPDFKVFGLFVFNHDNKKPISQRHPNPFDKRINDFALAHGFTVSTTADLFNAYLNIKNKILEPDELIEQLCKPGIFKILGHSQSPTNKPDPLTGGSRRSAV